MEEQAKRLVLTPPVYWAAVTVMQPVDPTPPRPNEPDQPDPSALEEEMALIVEGDLPPQRPQGKRVAAANSVLAAAMLGLGEVIEPQKTEVSIEAQLEASDDDPLDKFDFGDLPPLN